MGLCISTQQPQSMVGYDSDGELVVMTQVPPTRAEKRAQRDEAKAWKKEIIGEMRAAGFTNIKVTTQRG